MFDDQMRLSPGESGALQVTGGSVNVWGIVENYNIFVTEPGYIVVYIDNQSIGHDVWFDNVHLEHYTSEVLEEDHYYPFGLTISEDAATGAATNNYKLSTKELQTEFGVNYYDFGARMQDEQLGRWFNIDPLSEKYYGISPYAYVMNNPIKYIDPNGKEIWIHYQKDKRLRYDGGSLYNSDGSAYTGKVKGFLKKSVNALNHLSTSKTGKGLIGQLTKSSNEFGIVNAKNNPNKQRMEFVSSNKLKAFANQTITDPKLSSLKEHFDANGTDLNGGSGGTIYWDPGGKILPTTSGLRNDPEVELGHELAHGLDANNGNLDNRLEQGIKRDEWQATYRENMIRQELDVPLRTQYNTTIDATGRTTGGSGPAMVTPDNQPIVPFWYKN